MNVLVSKANGAHPPPFKLAVIGQITADKQRLLLRGISPESIRNHSYAAGRGVNGRIKALENHASREYRDASPHAQLFDSGLVLWDMFSPWWGWPKQMLDGTEQIAGHVCLILRSVSNDENSPVREVESCVDPQAKLSLRTRLFDAQHILIRTTLVKQFMRRGESGVSVAKKLAITDAGRMLTEIEIYAGDEQYQISADTFAILDM
jgi:hypothetical protein